METLLMLAVLPAAALLFYVWKMDPIEKEPPGLLAKLLLFGVVSTVPAIVLESVGSSLLLSASSLPPGIYLLVENFLVVALVEELCKFVFLRWRTWNHPAFDYVFDGIVYAVFVSLGFAIAENISYVFSYGFLTAVVRAVTAIPGHCIFAVFMGYFYAQAKLADAQGNGARKASCMLLTIVVPVFCHGAYDYWASIDGALALLVFFAVLIVMAVVASRLVKRLSAQAQRIGAVQPGADDASGTVL